MLTSNPEKKQRKKFFVKTLKTLTFGCLGSIFPIFGKTRISSKNRALLIFRFYNMYHHAKKVRKKLIYSYREKLRTDRRRDNGHFIGPSVYEDQINTHLKQQK